MSGAFGRLDWLANGVLFALISILAHCSQSVLILVLATLVVLS